MSELVFKFENGKSKRVKLTNALRKEIVGLVSTSTAMDTTLPVPSQFDHLFVSKASVQEIQVYKTEIVLVSNVHYSLPLSADKLANKLGVII